MTDTSTAETSAGTLPTSFPEVVSETRVIHGIRLPWQRVERYGPQTSRWNGTVSDHPPKGTVLESGEVFISLSTLEALADQDIWDSQFGDAFLLGHREGLALEAAGLAVQETRGGYHRSETLQACIENLHEQIVEGNRT